MLISFNVRNNLIFTVTPKIILVLEGPCPFEDSDLSNQVQEWARESWIKQIVLPEYVPICNFVIQKIACCS